MDIGRRVGKVKLIRLDKICMKKWVEKNIFGEKKRERMTIESCATSRHAIIEK